MSHLSVSRAAPSLAPLASLQNQLSTISPNALTHKVLQLLRHIPIGETKTELQQQFTTITPDQLHDVVTNILEEICNSTDVLPAVELLSELLPLEKLQEALPSSSPSARSKKRPNHQAIDALQSAKEMYQEALYYLQKTDTALTPTLSSYISSICDTMIQVVENLLAAFGIGNVFKPPENEMHADMKGQKIMSLFHLFDLLSRSMTPLAGDVLTGMITGGTLFFIAALSLIYPFFRPTPAVLPQGENWTKLYHQGLLAVSEGRKVISDAIYNALTHNQDRRHYPMLIGESGIGKTDSIRAFVQACARGNYPEFKDVPVFYFNTADLVYCSEMFTGSNVILSKIKESLGQHAGKVLIVFDEIHSACKDNEYSAIGEQLKTYLDAGVFPYFIAITTEDEFNEHIYKNNYAFSNRFEKIIVNSTDPNETLKILNGIFLKQTPELLLEDDVMEYLIKKTTEAFAKRAPQSIPQPTRSLDILSKCMRKCSKSQKSALQEKVEKIRTNIESLLSQNAVMQLQRGREPSKKELTRRKKITTLQASLRKEEALLAKETKEKMQLYKVRQTLVNVKKAMFHTAVKVAAFEKNRLSNTDERELTAFFLQRHFLVPLMQEKILAKAKELGVNTIIDTELVDAAIQERVDNDEKSALARERAKTQRKERHS